MPPAMQVGVNHPWAFNKYGWSIGPHERWIDRWLLDLERNLRVAKNVWRVGIVRIFVLCNGMNYGLGKRRNDAGKRIPAALSTRGWAFDPPTQLHPKFLSDFKDMLSVYKSVGMQMIPSLLDFGAFTATEAGGKHDLARDKDKRKIFLDTVLDELLRVSSDFRGQIYAWEVMNEPSWTARWFSPPLSTEVAPWRYLPRLPSLTEDQMVALLEDALAHIRAAQFESTVGHRTYGDLLKYPTTRGSKPQFHYYGWPWLDAAPAAPGSSLWHKAKNLVLDSVPEHASTGGAFIGEIGSGEYGRPWSELPDEVQSDHRTCVFERLKLLAKKGYELAFLWEDGHWVDPCADVPDASKGGCLESSAEDNFLFTSAAVQGLVDFTGGLFPGGVPA
jgi:hypothetical protein